MQRYSDMLINPSGGGVSSDHTRLTLGVVFHSFFFSYVLTIFLSLFFFSLSLSPSLFVFLSLPLYAEPTSSRWPIKSGIKLTMVTCQRCMISLACAPTMPTSCAIRVWECPTNSTRPPPLPPLPHRLGRMGIASFCFFFFPRKFSLMLLHPKTRMFQESFPESSVVSLLTPRCQTRV